VSVTHPALEGDTLDPLRIRGGIFGAIRAALGGWWREIFLLTGLNLVWVLAFFTVIALPPATVAIFFVARQVLTGDYLIGWQTFWQPFRRYFIASWTWALIFFVIAGVAMANIWSYLDAPGALWTVMRFLWVTMLLIWVTMNLFFWPFWFAQEPEYRTLRATWRNTFTFLVANPAAALLSTLLVLLLSAASFLTGVPLGTLFMVWTALLATAMLAAHLPPQPR
jgi:uncharacterized membrane protein YesL